MNLGERYGLLIGACTFTSLPGFLGFLFPKKLTKKYMGVFLSIGIGCLLATIFLHILPEVMEEAGKHPLAGACTNGVGHSHGGGHGHSHSHAHRRLHAGGGNKPCTANHELMRTMGVASLIGIIFAFIMENFLHSHDHGSEGDHGHGHGHGHGCGRHSISCHAHDAKEEIRLSVQGKMAEISEKPSKGREGQEGPTTNHTASNEGAQKVDKSEHNHAHVHDDEHDHSHEHEHEHEHDGSGEANSSKGAWSSAVISMIAAQMTHHACDGIVLGGMFGGDKDTGDLCLSTLPFFAHEFGQSISGYAVYINAGWSTLASVGLVMMGYAPMFVTATAMIFIATVDSVKVFFDKYCNPLAIGFFLYIVLADMVPDVIHYHSDTKWYNALAVVLSLVLTGVMIWVIPHSH